MEIGRLLIALQGDPKSWSDALKVAGQDLRRLAEQAKATGQDLTKFNTQSINLLKGWKNEVGDAYRGVEQSLAPVKQGLVDQGKALDVNQKGMTAMAIQTVTASEKLRVLSDSLKGTSSALWLMTMGLQQFGRAMTISFTVPIMAAAGLAIKTFMDWERGTIAIQRAAEITSEEAKKITDNFIRISIQVPLTVEELQKAGYAAAQAGVTGEKAITNFAQAAVMLSKVGGDAFKDLPIEDLANRLAKLAIAFGETGENWENVNKIGSALLVVAKAVPGGLAEIIEGMRRVAGTAKTMGISLAETTALVGTLVAAGIPAARTGTELSRIFLDMAKNADKVAEALGYTSAKAEEFKERMQTDVMGILVELIERYGLVENRLDRITHLQEIFGDVALRALLPLIDNADLLQDMLARANDQLESGTLLAAEFDIQANSLSGTLTVFRNAIQMAAKAVGDDLAPFVSYFLKTATTGLIALVEKWQDLNPHIKFAIVLMAGLLAVVGPLALLLNTLFLNPISGLVTFLTFSTRAAIALGQTATLGTLASVSMTTFASSMVGAAGAAAALVKGLVILSLKFAAILVVIGVVAAALYTLGKALGIRIKLPEMPKVTLPKYKGVGAPKVVAEEGYEELAEADKKAAKAREKELERELRDKRRARDKELRIIDKGISAYEKVRDAEIKERQKLVDEQRDALDQRREQWEDESRIEEEKIRIQQETLESVKETLKESKKTLSELRKVYDRELDTAEGRVDYAEMNLDAAQDALKREKILGRDEFDASFRAAEARVKAWEDATQLARENVIKVKREYQKQIDAQEDLVDINQEQVDIQTDALDDLRDALAERRAIVDKEIDVLNDELKIRQDALADTREATQEKLDLLREERDIRQEAWDNEIVILQDQLDAARDYAQDIKDMPVPELPDLAARMGELDEELKKQMEDMQAGISEAIGIGVELAPEAPLARFVESAKEKLSEIFSEETWNTIKEGLKTGWEGISTLWEGLWAGLKEKVTPGLKAIEEEVGGWLGRLKVSWDMIWERVKQDWEAFWTMLGNILKPITDFIGEILQTMWNNIKESFRRGGDFISQTWEGLWSRMTIFLKGVWDIFKGIIQIAWGVISGIIEVGLAILARNWSGAWEGIKNSFRNIWEGIKSILRGAWQVIESIFDFSGIWNKLNNLIKDAKNWGKDFINNLAGGIRESINEILKLGGMAAKALEKFLGFGSVPEKGPLHDTRKWGKELVKNYADSISEGLPYLERAMGDISGSLGTSFAGGASAAIPAGRAPVAETMPVGPTVNKNYYIQPGQMIATRGEVRNFVRLLKEYDKFEEER